MADIPQMKFSFAFIEIYILFLINFYKNLSPRVQLKNDQGPDSI